MCCLIAVCSDARDSVGKQTESKVLIITTTLMLSQALRISFPAETVTANGIDSEGYTKSSLDKGQTLC